MATNFGPKTELEARRLALEHEIGPAIETGQIEPYYQPLVDLRTGAVIGCEVLARWNHPVHGLLLPNLFIPAANAAGYIKALS